MRAPITIVGPKICTPKGLLQNTTVTFSNGLIKNIENDYPKDTEIFRCPSSWFLIPGMIDTHIHGASGVDLTNADVVEIQKMAEALPQEGVTAFLATTLTAPKDTIEKAVKNLGQYSVQQKQKKTNGAECLGIYLEGPFLSPHKAGAQDKKYLLAPDIALFDRWNDLSGHTIKMVGVSPELPNIEPFLQHLKENGVGLAFGHSAAAYEETCRLIEKYSPIQAIHLFNAMPPMHHRTPSMTGAFLLESEAYVELIVDGLHMHPAFVELAYRLKKPERILLITDSLHPKNLGDGIYYYSYLNNEPLNVKNKEARLSNGTLAGSLLKMNVALKNVMDFTHCTLFEAVTMACENPAKRLNLFHRKGSIEVGKDADLVLLDENFHVRQTFCRGEKMLT